MIKYRADIDGLRALAIVPVVLCHYGVAPFTGGFVGVDVFFVISGFLIASLIYQEMNTGTFSFVTFYERRIRRIFPALFVMLAAVATASFLLLFPTDLDRLGNSLMATGVFGSNVEFWTRFGYFDVVAARKPLLHTWSLAIEEQFYLIFPALLFFLVPRGHKARILAVIGVLFVLSLVASIWAAYNAPLSAFYLLPFRFWELMLGALLAIAAPPLPQSATAREAIAWCGLAAIGIAVFAFTEETPFPGAAALLPCVGAALIIYTGGVSTKVSQVLGTPLIVGIGLISYSLYLWHWPLLVFTRYALFRALTPPETAGLIVVSVVLAVLSWRYVEQPFRAPRKILSRRQLFSAAAAATALTLVVGAAGKMEHGWTQRFPADVQAILNAAIDDRASMPIRYDCLDPALPSVMDSRVCRIGARQAVTPSFLLWGDSHAEMLTAMVAEIADKAGHSGLIAALHTCPPLLGVDSNRSHHCREFNDETLRRALKPEIQEVFLTTFWGKNAEGTPYENEEGRDVVLSDGTTPGSVGENKDVLARGLQRLVAQLTKAGKRVVIVASVPEVGWPVPQTLARIKLFGLTRDIRPSVDKYLARQASAFAILASLRAKYGIAIIYPHSLLCDAAVCRVTLDSGEPAYDDGAHLTYSGTKLLAPLFEKYF